MEPGLGLALAGFESVDIGAQLVGDLVGFVPAVEQGESPFVWYRESEGLQTIDPQILRFEIDGESQALFGLT